MEKSLNIPDDTLLFFVDAEGLLLQQTSQRIFGLNTFSAFLWSHLETDPSIEYAIRNAIQQLGLKEQLAREYTQLAIEQWREMGLFEPQSEPERPNDNIRQLTNVAGIDPLGEYGPMQQITVSLADTLVSIYVDDPIALSAIRAVIGHLEVNNGERQPSTGPISSIHVCHQQGHCTVYRNREPVAHFANPDSIAPTTKSILLQEAIDNFDFLLYLHAGVLSNGRTLTLLPGAQGAGKSTLTAGLTKAGLTYYSDEVALLSQNASGIRPFPIALCSKEAAWPVLAKIFPGIDSLPSFSRLDRKTVRYIPPPVDLLDPDYDRPLPVKNLVFPTYSPEATTKLIPISRVTALQRLMVECLAIKHSLTAEATHWLVEWIAGIDCYALPNSSLEESVKAVKELAG